jgi:hypothetical protein
MMRARVLAIVFGVLVFLPGVPTGCGSRDVEVHTMTAAAQIRQRAEALDRRFMDIQRELYFREAAPRFRKQFPGLDVSELESSLLRPVDPQLRAMSSDSLKLAMQVIKLEFGQSWELLTYGVGMSRMFLEAPAEPTAYTRANYPTSAAVVAIIPRSEFTENAGHYLLSNKPLTQVADYYLCDADVYYGKPVAKVEGTGFLIDGGRIVTANHVVGDGTWLDSVYFVFDYAWKADESPNLEFDSTQLFTGSEVVARFSDPGPARRSDCAMIQLAAVPSRAPLEYRDSGSVDEGADVYMIGHPNGLPQMYTGVGTVVDATDCWRIKVKLDTYTYSSGSPVINAASQEAEGILVWDVGNYVRCDVCSIRGVYGPEYGFAGAEATRCTEFAEWLRHPTTVVVATELDYAEVTGNGALYYLSNGNPEVQIPGVANTNGDLEVTITVPSGCETRSSPNVGQRWKVVNVDGHLTLRRDCLH